MPPTDKQSAAGLTFRRTEPFMTVHITKQALHLTLDHSDWCPEVGSIVVSIFFSTIPI